jgi:hypothetical protein
MIIRLSIIKIQLVHKVIMGDINKDMALHYKTRKPGLKSLLAYWEKAWVVTGAAMLLLLRRPTDGRFHETPAADVAKLVSRGGGGCRQYSQRS